MSSFDTSASMLLHVKHRFYSRARELHAMSVVQVKIVYSYYSAERVTPIFLKEEELLGLSYEAFKWKIVNEIPHLTTDMDMLRLTVLDEGYQVDISPAYFQHQIKGILEKHAMKAIEVKALVFQSPGVASPPRKEINTSNVALSSPVSKKKLPCRSLNMVLKQSLIESGSENTQQTRNPPTCLPNKRLGLALTRAWVRLM